MTARSILTSIVAAALALSVCVTGVAAQPAGTLLVGLVAVASGSQVLQCDIPAAGFLGGQRPMSHCKT